MGLESRRLLHNNYLSLPDDQRMLSMKRIFYPLLFLAIFGLMIIPGCKEEGEEVPAPNPYLTSVLGKWLAWQEVHESIRKNTTDTLSVLTSPDTNLLVFSEIKLLTYYTFPDDTNNIITEFYKGMTDSVIFFGGYPYNTGEILFVSDSTLIFKRFKGWYVPMDTKDTIHHTVIYSCDRIKDEEEN